MSDSHEMTWKEFKDLLNKQEIPDDATIDWVDFSHPMVYPNDEDGYRAIDVYYNEAKKTVIIQ